MREPVTCCARCFRCRSICTTMKPSVAKRNMPAARKLRLRLPPPPIVATSTIEPRLPSIGMAFISDAAGALAVLQLRRGLEHDLAARHLRLVEPLAAPQCRAHASPVASPVEVATMIGVLRHGRDYPAAEKRPPDAREGGFRVGRRDAQLCWRDHRRERPRSCRGARPRRARRSHVRRRGPRVRQAGRGRGRRLRDPAAADRARGAAQRGGAAGRGRACSRATCWSRPPACTARARSPCSRRRRTRPRARRSRR